MKVDREWLKANATVTMKRAYEDSIDWHHEFRDAPETLDWIQGQIDMGNEWAWCEVTVRVSFQGFDHTEHIGGCSYENENAFREGGYYDDMVDECVGEIADAFDKLLDTHGLWQHERRSCILCIAEHASA